MRLREQLASASQREAVQRQQLRTCEDNLAMCLQELEELKHQLQQKPLSEALDESDSSVVCVARERAMLQFVLELVGRDRVQALLNEFPDASPAQLRLEILQLVRTQQHFSAAPVVPRSITPNQRVVTNTKKPSSSPSPPSRSPSTLDAVYEKYVREPLNVSRYMCHTSSCVVSGATAGSGKPTGSDERDSRCRFHIVNAFLCIISLIPWGKCSMRLLFTALTHVARALLVAACTGVVRPQ